MVIDEFDVESGIVAPDKTYPPLVVDADRPLAQSVAIKCVQLVPRRNAAIFDACDSSENKNLGNDPFVEIE